MPIRINPKYHSPISVAPTRLLNDIARPVAADTLPNMDTPNRWTLFTGASGRHIPVTTIW
jgi:hypothetical protein